MPHKVTPCYCKRKTCSEALEGGLPLEQCQSLANQEGLPCMSLKVAWLPDANPQPDSQLQLVGMRQ